MVVTKVEEYLKAICDFQDDDTRVAPSAMAGKPPTVTTMLQRMHDDGFVDYEPYLGGRLTTGGKPLEVSDTCEQFSLPTEPTDIFVSQCDERSTSEIGQFSEAR